MHLFGHVATGTASRGELFMFWHLSHAPVLISLMAGGWSVSSQPLAIMALCCANKPAGEAAIKFESLPDDVIVAKALSVLRSIFGDQIPEVNSPSSVPLLMVADCLHCRQLCFKSRI